ncbi:MAG: outer membrane homotrimeric porin [Desulfovibrionaceae bacterium]|nr:outer membrane homotrimeric porin [Desulfovibrionaceae bacterium]MBF0513850.1 outer membrane homotrimeric porin [Desulfovibrionaceae bacterium]
MKRLICIALAAVFGLGFAAAASAETEVVMSGDARIHANIVTHENFTPWNARGMNYYTGAPQAAIAGISPGTASEENFTIWERFRLKTDFIANETLMFRLGIRVNNVAWGASLAVDNPPVAIDVNQAYLKFFIPNTQAQVSAGYMPLALPQSKIFGGSLILDTQWGNTSAAAAVVDIPVVTDTFAIKAGYTRLLSGAADFYAGGVGTNATTPVADAVDLFFLALPVTIDGFQAIPWASYANAGRMANWSGLLGGTALGPTAAWGEVDSSVSMNMVSAASAKLAATSGFNSMWANQSNSYYWFGLPLNITALDPVNFYADVLYGAGAMDDRSQSKRSGWFIDAGVEYTGLSFMKPQLMGWWSTGENGSLNDGSERIPFARSFWNVGGSFLYSGNATAFTRNTLLCNPAGSWGLALSFKDISFVKDLTHRLTIAVVNGTNSPSWARAVASSGLGGIYATMGKDLTTDEWLVGVNFDHMYKIYDNLDAILELGWADVSGLRGSVWGPRNVNNAGDAWKVAFGLRYTF